MYKYVSSLFLITAKKSYVTIKNPIKFLLDITTIPYLSVISMIVPQINHWEVRHAWLLVVIIIVDTLPPNPRCYF